MTGARVIGSGTRPKLLSSVTKVMLLEIGVGCSSRPARVRFRGSGWGAISYKNRADLPPTLGRDAWYGSGPEPMLRMSMRVDLFRHPDVIGVDVAEVRHAERYEPRVTSTFKIALIADRPKR